MEQMGVAPIPHNSPCPLASPAGPRSSRRKSQDGTFPGNSPVNLYRVCCAIDLSHRIGCPGFLSARYWWFRLREKRKEAALAWIQLRTLFLSRKERKKNVGWPRKEKQKSSCRTCHSFILCLGSESGLGKRRGNVWRWEVIMSVREIWPLWSCWRVRQQPGELSPH